MDYVHLKYIIGLLQCKGISSQKVKKIIHHFGTIEQLIQQDFSNLKTIKNFPVYYLNFNTESEHYKKASKILEDCKKHQIHCVSIYDSDYPKLLKECPDAPVILYYKGNIKTLQINRTLSIVGTRSMTLTGKRNTQTIVKEIQAYQPIIISGLALGVDVCAHEEALKNNLKTICVLAHGLTEVFPKTNAKIAHQILKNNGAWISEYPPHSIPKRTNFLNRNRIVAGLSKATLVVESAKKGGALVTAKYANSYNREVYTFPGPLDLIQSQGCHELIKNHQARLITTAEDIVKDLNWNNNKPEIIQKKIVFDLPENQSKIVNLLKERPLNFDELIQKTNYSTNSLNEILFDLEMQDIVHVKNGNIYELRT